MLYLYSTFLILLNSAIAIYQESGVYTEYRRMQG